MLIFPNIINPTNLTNLTDLTSDFRENSSVKSITETNLKKDLIINTKG